MRNTIKNLSTLFFIVILVLAGCGGGSSEEVSGGGGVSSGNTSSTEDYYGTIILPSRSSQQPADLMVSSVASKQAVNMQGNFQKPQFLGNQQVLFVNDQVGNVILMGYYFPENASVPDSLQNYVLSQGGVTITAESTAFALCLNSPILSGLDISQLIEVASIVIELPEFISFVGKVENLLVTDSSNILDITAYPEIFMKANQITDQALSIWGQSSSAISATVSSVMSKTTIASTAAPSATVVVDNRAAYVKAYYDPFTNNYSHEFANEVFVTYVAEFSSITNINPFPPLLIDRDRTLKLNWCSDFPFLCWQRATKYTPFDVGSGDYTITVWRGFSSDMWLASDGSMFYSKCITDGFSDAPCIASQLAFLDITSPVLALIGIKVTGVQIVNGLDNFVGFDMESLWQVYEVIKDISIPSVIDSLSILTNVVEKNSMVLASILKNSEIEFNGDSIPLFADTDETQLAEYIKKQSGMFGKLLRAAGAIKTVKDAAATLIPMAIDFHNSPEKVTYYLQDGKLVERLPLPVALLDFISPPNLSQKTLSVGAKIQFGVSGQHADSSMATLTDDQVQWDVIGDIGTIASNGSFTATSIGTGYVTVSYNELYAHSDQFSIVSSADPSLIKIAVEGPSAVSSGQTAQYAALGIYDDGSSMGLSSEVSWSVQGSIGTVSSTGLFNASQDGTGSIKASYSGADGTSSMITVSAAGEPPLTPTNLNGVAVSSTQVNLTWNQSAGATNYIVYRNGVRIGTSTVSSYSDSRLLQSVTYAYSVVAFGPNGVSPQSYPVNVTTTSQSTVTIPAIPTITSPGTTYSPGPTTSSATVSLSWSSISGVTYYELGVRDIATDTLVVSTTASGTSYSASLVSDKQYRWNMAACNSAGCSNFTTPLYFQTPDAMDAPKISSLSLASVPADDVDRTLTIYGSSFSSGNVVKYRSLNPVSNSTKNTSVSSASQLSASFNPGDVTDTIYVKVCRSSTSIECSDELSITVTDQASVMPDLQVLNGSSVSSNGTVSASWTLANKGTGTASASTTVVRINQSSTSAAGSNLASISTPGLTGGGSQSQSTTLTAPTAVGTYYVWVLADNYSTAGQSTSAVANDLVRIGSFTVAVASPSINSLSSTAFYGACSDQFLVIYGSNFVSGATVNLYDQTNGVSYTNRTVTFNSAGQLTLSATYGGSTANWSLTVVNPDGSSSASANFSIIGPTITGVYPNPVPRLDGTQTITFYGAGFLSGAAVQIDDGTGPYAMIPTVLSSGQMTISAYLTSATATWKAQIRNCPNLGDTWSPEFNF